MKNIYTTTLRLNLDKSSDKKAWEHLKQLDKEKHRSVNQAIIDAINDFYRKEEALKDDPYLETRKKEDAFLDEMRETIREGLGSTYAFGLAELFKLMQNASAMATNVTAKAEPPDEKRGTDRDMDAALDFADSF